MQGGQNNQLPRGSQKSDSGFIPSGLKAYLEVPFKALALVVWVFRVNRAWLAGILAHRGAAVSIQGFFLLTVVVWLVIRFLAD